jgi:hypothetical protein
MFRIRGAILLLGLLISRPIHGQFINKGPDRVLTPLHLPLKKIGTLRPRSTTEITASNITVGCETLDRSLTNFNEYKNYLPPLGVKKIRLQAGWARTEKVKGVYDWEWLDKIIDFAVEHKLEPWVEFSYGNPVYAGGGGTGLLNSLPTSDVALAAWDRWVEAMVIRYKGKVREWEIWNEPDHPMQQILPETIAALNIRTAEIVKRVQPDSRIAGLAFASHTDTEYLDRFLKYISERNKLGLFDWISYHSYAYRPEDSYRGVAMLEDVLRKYSRRLKLRQGENGAPSTFIPGYALDKYNWTEYSQAKYDLRRLLGDLGRGIETSVFTIIDIYYRGSNPVLNTKGLIQSDTSCIAIRPKVAYYAVQNLASIFDASLLPDSLEYQTTSQRLLSVFSFKKVEGKGTVIAFWDHSNVPANSFSTQPVEFLFQNIQFNSPVLVDLLTGNVFEIPPSYLQRKANKSSVTLPVYDSPMLLMERADAVLLKN